MARTITYQQAINEALAQEMERDPTVVLFGEDVSGGMGSPGEEDAWGGVLGRSGAPYALVARSGQRGVPSITVHMASKSRRPSLPLRRTLVLRASSRRGR